MNKKIIITNIVKNEITINNCYNFKVPYDIFKEMGLKLDLDITDVYNKLMYKCMLYKGFRSLNVSFKTKKEISLKIEREYCNNEYFKSINNKIKNKVIEYLEEKEYINDYEYSVNYIQNRSNKSILQLKKSLIVKGVDKEIVEKCIKDYKEENGLDNERENIFKILDKSIHKLDDEKEKRKIFNKLLYRGYSYGTIKEIYNEIKNKK